MNDVNLDHVMLGLGNDYR